MSPTYGSRSPETDPDRLVEGLAVRQFGVFTRRQALACGVPPSTVAHRLAEGRWETIYRGVYRFPAAPKSWEQDMLSACFAWGDDVFLACTAAASLHKLGSFRLQEAVLIVPADRRRSLPHRVHRLAPLTAFERSTSSGIPVTSVARTLLDVSRSAPVELVEEALDDALRRRLVSLPQLRWYLGPPNSRSKPGTKVLRALVEMRGSTRVSESALETRLFRVLRRGHLPLPVAQHEVRDEGIVIARLDFAYPAQRVAIEAHGYRWHGGRARWERDLARHSRLAALGWRIVHVTWEMLGANPELVVERLRGALGIRPLIAKNEGARLR